MSTTPTHGSPLDYQTPIRKPRAGPGKWLLRIGIGAALLVGGIAVLLPSLCKSRESANRAKCVSNLHQIGLAILLYANDHAGAYPDSFATLIQNEQITPAVFVCPSSNDEAATGDTQAAMLTDLAKPNHCSYVYLGNGMNSGTVKDDALICYEPPENHQQEGMNMLFGDGHAEWFDLKTAQAMIAKATTRPSP